jgi:hypothetical protein
MVELGALAAVFLAFALLHGAEAKRRPPGLARLAPAWKYALRVAALAVLAWGIGRWAGAEDATAAILVILTAFCAAATFFVLAASVFPRLAWGLALACAPALVLLSLLGGCHG